MSQEPAAGRDAPFDRLAADYDVLNCLPDRPAFAGGLGRRRPTLVDRLARLDRRWAHRFPAPWLSDHFLVQFERCATTAQGTD